MTKMKSFMDFETKGTYSKEYLEGIRQYLENTDIIKNKSIGEYFIKKIQSRCPTRMRDSYVLFDKSRQEIALAFQYTLKSDLSHFSPGRTKVASILPQDELEKIVNDIDEKVALINLGKLAQKEKNKC